MGYYIIGLELDVIAIDLNVIVLKKRIILTFLENYNLFVNLWFNSKL